MRNIYYGTRYLFTNKKVPHEDITVTNVNVRMTLANCAEYYSVLYNRSATLFATLNNLHLSITSCIVNQEKTNKYTVLFKMSAVKFVILFSTIFATFINGGIRFYIIIFGIKSKQSI